MAFLKSFAIFILASGGMSAGMFFRVRVLATHPEGKEFMSTYGEPNCWHKQERRSVNLHSRRSLHVANEEIGHLSFAYTLSFTILLQSHLHPQQFVTRIAGGNN